jgi:transposase
VPSRFEIDDDLWSEIAPLIPARERRHRYPGRKAIPDRLVLSGILHVVHTGIAWEDLPSEYGYGSGVTCWRRLRDWQAARSRHRPRGRPREATPRDGSGVAPCGSASPWESVRSRRIGGAEALFFLRSAFWLVSKPAQ